MRSELMRMAAACGLLVSFACGCAMETGGDEGTPGTTETTEGAQGVYAPRPYFGQVVNGVPGYDLSGYYGMPGYWGMGYGPPGMF